MSNAEITTTERTQIATTQQQLDNIVERFIASQDVKQSSKGLYRRTLHIYLQWVEQQGLKMDEIDRCHILQYKEHLLADCKSSLTVGSYITSVRRFYEWLEGEKIYPNVARGVKSPRKKNQFRKQPLYPDQSKAMLENEKENCSSRDYALVNLLIRTGLRTIEVSRANVEDITYMGGQRVLRIMGKGHVEKDDFVVLTERAYKPLEKYLLERMAVATEPLFTSESNRSKGGRMTTRAISHIAKEALQRSGFDDRVYTAHSLRHTAAISILLAGGTQGQVQRALRHTNPATTQIYTATLDEKLRLTNSGEQLIDNLF